MAAPQVHELQQENQLLAGFQPAVLHPALLPAKAAPTHPSPPPSAPSASAPQALARGLATPYHALSTGVSTPDRANPGSMLQAGGAYSPEHRNFLGRASVAASMPGALVVNPLYADEQVRWRALSPMRCASVHRSNGALYGCSAVAARGACSAVRC